MKRLLTALSLVVVTLPAAARDLLAVTWDGNVYRMSSETAESTHLGYSGWSFLNALARNSKGEFYTVSSKPLGSSQPATILKLDPLTGLATPVAPSSLTEVRALAFGPNDELYAIGYSVPFKLYRLDLQTGAATLIGNLSGGFFQALACYGGELYAWECGGGSGFGKGLMKVDPATGAATDVNPQIGGTCYEVQGLAFDGHGNLYGANKALRVVKVRPGAPLDPGLGGTVPIALTGLEIRGLDFIVPARRGGAGPTR